MTAWRRWYGLELKGCQWQSKFAGNLEMEEFVSFLAKPRPVGRGRLFGLDGFSGRVN